METSEFMYTFNSCLIQGCKAPEQDVTHVHNKYGDGDTCLQILHGVPVMLQEDDGVSGSQIEAEAADSSCQQHDRDGGIAVEALHDAKPGRCLHTVPQHQMPDQDTESKQHDWDGRIAVDIMHNA